MSYDIAKLPFVGDADAERRLNEAVQPMVKEILAMQDENALKALAASVNQPANPHLQYQLAQLRHLYCLLANGLVKDQAEAARGLLGPVIEELEKMLDSAPTPVQDDPIT